jgi:membrane protease YdiL (CAAX protease family)
MIYLNTEIFLVYGLLSAAMLSIWLPETKNIVARIPIWSILLIASCSLALYNNFLEFGAIVYLFGLIIACILYKSQNRWISISSGLFIVGLVIGLFLHKVPYFNNTLVFDDYRLSDQSSGYTKYFNFDKAAAGLILLAYFGDIARSASEWLAMIKKVYLISSVTIIVTFALAIIVGYLDLDMTFSFVFFAWAWSNLFFTCIAEEMLFRGVIQKHLLDLVSDTRYQVLIVLFVGVLFGFAHYAGGITYAIFASVAGIGYGYTYYRSGRIESAILTHFLLNSIHFLFFTYPFKSIVVYQ